MMAVLCAEVSNCLRTPIAKCGCRKGGEEEAECEAHECVGYIVLDVVAGDAVVDPWFRRVGNNFREGY